MTPGPVAPQAARQVLLPKRSSRRTRRRPLRKRRRSLPRQCSRQRQRLRRRRRRRLWLRGNERHGCERTAHEWQQCWVDAKGAASVVSFPARKPQSLAYIQDISGKEALRDCLDFATWSLLHLALMRLYCADGRFVVLHVSGWSGAVQKSRTRQRTRQRPPCSSCRRPAARCRTGGAASVRPRLRGLKSAASAAGRLRWSWWKEPPASQATLMN